MIDRTWLSPVTAGCLLLATLSLAAQETEVEEAEAPPVVEEASEEAQEDPVQTQPAEDDAAEPDAPAPKRPVSPADYGKWESLGFSTALSPDGKWLAYQISRVNGESELRLRMLATDSSETFEYGSGPAFSDDNNWLAFRIGMSEEDREKQQKSGKPVRNQLGLHDLTSGETTEIENVASFSFSDDGAYLIMRRYPIKGRDSSGVDLVVRDLASSVDTNIGNVSTYAWNDDGTLLAMIIDAEDQAGNGVQLYDAAKATLRTLDSADAKYNSLVWREDAADLGVLREIEHEDDEDVSHTVITWRNLAGAKSRKSVYDHTDDDAFPQDMHLVNLARLAWSDDGKTVFFGIKEWENKPEALNEEEEDEEEGEDNDEVEESDEGEDETDDEEDEEAAEEDDDAEKKPGKKEEDSDKPLRETLKDPSNVEVWHAADIDIIPRQKVMASRDERESHLAALWIEDGTFVPLANDLTEQVFLLEKQKHSIGRDNTPYEELKRFGPTLNDLYIIDNKTGDRTKAVEGVKFYMGSGPNGRHVAYAHDGSIWLLDVKTGATRNLTGETETHFINQEATQLTDEKSPYGVAGWTESGDRVLLYDRYDIWMFAVGGSSATRLTRGAEESIRHRRVILDREEDEFIDTDRPMYMSIYGDRTKQSGYARLTIDDAPAPPEVLIMKDKSISRLTKAKDAEVYAITAGDADDSPDIFVDGPALDALRQVTETNQFQSDYLWTRSELYDFQSTNGDKLQGALFYPADYDPAKTYPMIVYIYELVSQSMHRYSTPSERNPYNTAVWTSEGYFVYQPDIVYRPQNPGLSSVECVVPGVQKIIDTGLIDPDRIGLVGHSWGAYQTAFIVTQTDMFAAGIAGAPLTNMMSMSMSIYWNSGQSDAWIFHESQGRMDRPFWQDVDTYIKNSPIFSMDDLNTPLMIAFGTDDGAVDFNQGVEMYNAARLAEKDFVMLVYPGENHGLRQKENQVDYHYRVLEWFGHYVKGDEPEAWITEGVPHLDRKKEIEAMKKGKKD